MKKSSYPIKFLVSFIGITAFAFSCQKPIDEITSSKNQMSSYPEIERVVSQMRAVSVSQLPSKGASDAKVLWPDWASVVVCDLVGGAVGGGLGGVIGAVALGAGASAAAYGGLYGVAPSSNDYPNQTQTTWPTWVENDQNPFDDAGEDHNDALNFAADSSSVWMMVSGSNQTTDFPKLLDVIETEFGRITPSITSSDLTSIANHIDDLHNAALLNEYLDIITAIENDNFISTDVKDMMDVIVEDLYYEDDPEIMVSILKDHEVIIEESSLDEDTKETMAQAISIGRYSIGYWFAY